MTSAIQAVSAAVVPATAATSQTAMRNRPHEALCVLLRLESSLAGVLSLLCDVTDSAPHPTLGHVDSMLIAATRQLAGAIRKLDVGLVSKRVDGGPDLANEALGDMLSIESSLAGAPSLLREAGGDSHPVLSHAESLLTATKL